MTERLSNSGSGYFKDPYLVWFIADNPTRTGRLPANIVSITKILIEAIRRYAYNTLKEQLNYALVLVVTGSAPRECGVQLPLIDLLLNEGADPPNPHGALAHNNIEAARRLVERGAGLSLTTAICLERTADIERFAKQSSKRDLEVALVAASFFGKTAMINMLIELGVDVNVYLDKDSGFHSHGTALHQAVSSGSLSAVKTLVEAGANLRAKDRVYDGMPVEWAQHLRMESVLNKEEYEVVAAYLMAAMKQ